ncbi:hypothetical protein [Macrococcus equipercicus]|uniref:Uncharacterized protein n=1 Tax=Macrococcus equipercicus TaxID=69967 RepID=A0A9Q9BTX1_9STAP|nr:hypothetical protein [Macrococcus equipercicus]KAA1040183.1 hypothetical protein ERX35_004120 [Macrococcus equipercicus]UTH12872.1 hypothetical protein KFV11_06180 [Macrococcus equipercicus]
MDFIAQYQHDNQLLEQRYTSYKCPEINPYIASIVRRLDISSNIKKAVLAIDSSMRYADTITHSNKATALLTTDLLSALFYRYMAEPFNPEQFKLLTQAVKDQNIWKAQFKETGDLSLIARIETAFIAPFMSLDDTDVVTLIQQSSLNNLTK